MGIRAEVGRGLVERRLSSVQEVSGFRTSRTRRQIEPTRCTSECPLPSPGASLCSCILLIVKHADRRRECGCFTGPHELSTGSGSSGPSWNHVPWRNSQVNRESRRFLRRPRGGCPDACGCIVLHAPDRRHLSRFWHDKPCSTAMPAGPHTFESRVGWTQGSFP